MARQIGPYEVIRRLAVGGGAEIVLAKRGGAVGFQQRCAIKVLLPRYRHDEQFRKMIVDEARLTSQLDHPNIIKVHDLGEDGDLLYMVMEYVHGSDLSHLLKRVTTSDTPFPVESATFIAREICAGLHYAHNRTSPEGAPLHLVHRDVSPQNVLVGYDGGVKLIDFGVAKASLGDRIETKTGIIKGKLTYMAPEYAVGSLQDARSDIFSAALCLWEALAGRSAYEIENPQELMRAVKYARIPAIRDIRPDIPPDLNEILATALRTHPQERYQSAQQMRDALTGFLSGYAPSFTRESLSSWLGALQRAEEDSSEFAAAQTQVLREGSEPATISSGQRNLPDAVDVDDEAIETAQLRQEDVEALMAARRGAAGSAGAEQSEAEPDNKTSRLDGSDALLGLADLAQLGEPGENETVDDDIAVLETIAMENGPSAPGSATCSDDVPTIDSEAGVRLAPSDRDEPTTDRLPTAELRIAEFDRDGSRLDLEADMPTATDLDVADLRIEEQITEEQPGGPQILTQSGFRRFMTADEIQRIKAQSDPVTISEPAPAETTEPTRNILPAHTPQPRAPLQRPSNQNAPPSSRPDQSQPVQRQKPQPPPQGPQQQGPQQQGPPPQGLQQQGAPFVPSETPPPTGLPLARRKPGLEGPNVSGESDQKMSKTATGLPDRLAQRYDDHNSSETGNRRKDAAIVAVLAIIFVSMLLYVLFLAN